MDAHEKRQHERAENITMAGIGIAALAALSTPFWGPLVAPDKKQDVAAYVQPAAEQHLQTGKQGKPGQLYLHLRLGEGRNLELALLPNAAMNDVQLVSTTLSLDESVRADWAQYAPVKIVIPELTYTQHFPVEQGERVLHSLLNHTIRSPQTVHYFIIGKNPATGKGHEIANHALHLGGRPK